MEKITKEEFLKRFKEAEVAGIALDDNRKSLNSRNIEEIRAGDYYRKDEREHVVISVDDNVVEIN
jgi:CRISPR/Cas system CMR-associated protein Cmr3 (group 5 of RAMP superfamily)